MIWIASKNKKKSLCSLTIDKSWTKSKRVLRTNAQPELNLSFLVGLWGVVNCANDTRLMKRMLKPHAIFISVQSLRFRWDYGPIHRPRTAQVCFCTPISCLPMCVCVCEREQQRKAKQKCAVRLWDTLRSVSVIWTKYCCIHRRKLPIVCGANKRVHEPSMCAYLHRHFAFVYVNIRW